MKGHRVANKTNVKIGIASEFDAKGFRAAQKATNDLDVAVGKLGKKLAGAFSAYKIAQFSKESIKAFANDQKAAANLANTLKNIGYGQSTKSAEAFIATLQKQTGILDDDLRPAYAQLLQVTGSMAETQKLMGTAFDVSRGTGQDYKTVIDALSQAYVGNTRGLRQLNAGLTATELKTKSFGELVDILSNKFAGAGAASVDTFQGKLDLLNVSIANTKEIIGQGFVDAFATIANDQNFQNVTSTIENMGQFVADSIRGIGIALDKLKSGWNSLPSPLKNIGNIIVEANRAINPLSILSRLGAKQRVSQAMPSGINAFLDEQNAKSAATASIKAEKAAAARAKTLADATKKQLLVQQQLNKKKEDAAKLDALSLKYKQAESIFNLDQIEVAAAMQNKQTNEDMARLKLKQDLAKLQDAINSGDVAAATAVAKVVEEDLKRVQAYQAISAQLATQQGTADKIKAAIDAMSPKQLFDLKNIDDALDKVATLITKLTEAKVIWSSALSTASDEFPKKIGGGGGSSTSSANGSTATGNSVLDSLIAAGGSWGGGRKGGSQLDRNAAARLQEALGESITDVVSETVTSVAETVGSAVSGGSTVDVSGITDGADLGFINMGTNSAPVVNVQVTDNAAKMVDVVMDITQNQSANGNPTRVTRIASNLAW